MMRNITSCQGIKNKRVLVRVDFNVTFERDGKSIVDDFRLKAALPTIRWLTERGARVILMSHLGRPGSSGEKQCSLKPVAKHLSQLLKKNVEPLHDAIGDEVEDDVLALKSGSVALLENLRFHAGEEQNDETFAYKLSRLGNFYVNDAFGASHRKHASLFAITKYLPSYAGLLLAKEVLILSQVLSRPRKPLVLVVGGAKIETKLPVIKNFLKRASKVLVGGAVANTFLAAKKYNVESSRVEKAFIPVACRMLRNKKILLPSDVVTSPNPHGKRHIMFRDVSRVHGGEMILDIGPKTLERFSAHIAAAKTVVWNGPVGLFEIPAFAHGTESIAHAIAKSSAYSIVGGGETGIVLKRLGLEDDMDHISTGGGAMLDFLAGKKLPALAALGYYER